jgi:DNA polymerase-1
MRTTTGISTEAVYIFHNMLRKLVNEYKPEFMAAVFESSAGPTFRSEAFADYKANRAEMPPDLGDQIPYVRKLLDAMRIPIIEFPGFEADDVIGAIAKRTEESGDAEVVIVSSDKDMLQLVSDRVSMLNPMKDDTWYDAAKTVEFMGVPPSGVADLLALKGDTIDNIPGAPGIGDKGARDLIVRFGSVENALERAQEVEKKTYRESLLNHRDQILLSKQLAKIDTNTPVEWCLASASAQPPDIPALRAIYKELEFFSLLKEVGPVETAEGKNYRSLLTADEVSSYVSQIPPEAPLAIAVDSAIGLSWRRSEARGLQPELAGALQALFSDESRPKIVHDLKSARLKLREMGLDLQGPVHDVMLYAFLLSADPGGCSCEVLAEKFLDRKLGGSMDMRADCALELFAHLNPSIDERGFRKIYDEIDRPLIDVLERMERTGVRVEPKQLSVLSGRLDAEVQRLSAQIYDLAGAPFNINSPQQLAKVLYDDLGLPSPVKYGKGKTTSTAADVLEALAADHEIAKLVLEYRQITKLKGTYTT